MEATNRIYDFIVRYHRSDLEMVAYIVSDLNRRGFHPWFDRWSIIRGVEPSRQLDSGISSSRSVVFFVGDRYPAPSEEPGLPGHHVRSLSEDGLPVTLVLLPGAKKHVNYQPTFVKDAFCIDFQDDFKARDKIKELSDRLQSVSRTDTDIPQIAFARENSSGQYPFTSELTNINITVYNSIAEKFAGIWANHPPQQILELLNKHLNGRPSTILDAGCGPGHHSEYLKQRRHDVIGIDFSEGMAVIDLVRVFRFET